MREIRFRLWDVSEKLFINDGFSIDMDGYAWHDDNGNSHVIAGRYFIMQYTGLKDKNGKEIYEGDIVIIRGSSPEDGDVFYQIEWRPLVYMIVAVELHITPYNIWVTLEEIEECEIIGNIHENHEWQPDFK